MPEKSLRLLVDLSAMRPGGEGGGIKPALLELLRWLGAHGGPRLELIHVVRPECRAEIVALARRSDWVVDRDDAPPDLAARANCGLVYCPFGVTDLACPGIPTVTLVVDLLHRDFPATLPAPDRIYREQKFAAAVAVTDAFQVISDFTAGRLHLHYPVSNSRIFRTYLPVQGRLHSDAAGGRPYFFYPGNLWIHKNHDLLLQAYALYHRTAGDAAWPLVLVGHPHPGRIAALQQLAQSLDIAADVEFRGYVSDADLAGCYRAAGALVFPSRHEGFGIPLLEAMAFGLPIVASQGSSIPEITGGAALLVDTAEAAPLAAALGRIAQEPELRASLSSRGRERLKHFSADVEFGRLQEFLFTVAQEPARYRHRGYHTVDGLIEGLAIFALPPAGREITVALVTRPLGVVRTLKVACGADVVMERIIPADRPEKLSVTFRPRGRALTLQVPDAASLSATDTRVHGVLLEQLRAQTTDGRWHDLLNPAPSRPATAPPGPLAAAAAAPVKYVWHLETPLPASLPDGCLELRGWCLRTDSQPAHLRIRVGGIDWRVAASLPRPDVQAAYPQQASDACGFAARMRVPAGRHELVLEAVEGGGAPVQLIRHRLSVDPLAFLRRALPATRHGLLAFQLMVGPAGRSRVLVPERFPARGSNGSARLRFSIVTPSYEQARFLGQTMRSVLDQPAVEGDYVVQDGGSTDGSVELIRRIAGETGPSPANGDGGRPRGSLRLAAWESAPDAGQADAIVRGFAKTAGGPDDLMAWINSDDRYLPGALPFVAGYFARHPDVDVVYGNRILIDGEAREIGRWFLPAHDAAVLRLNDFVPQETLFWRRRIWERVGGLDASFKFALDWDLLLRFQDAGARIVHVPRFLACFRVHAAQKTLAAMHDTGQREIDRLRERANGRPIPQSELEGHPRLDRYLRRSALIELGWNVGVRLG